MSELLSKATVKEYKNSRDVVVNLEEKGLTPKKKDKIQPDSLEPNPTQNPERIENFATILKEKAKKILADKQEKLAEKFIKAIDSRQITAEGNSGYIAGFAVAFSSMMGGITAGLNIGTEAIFAGVTSGGAVGFEVYHQVHQLIESKKSKGVAVEAN